MNNSYNVEIWFLFSCFHLIFNGLLDLHCFCKLFIYVTDMNVHWFLSVQNMKIYKGKYFSWFQSKYPVLGSIHAKRKHKDQEQSKKIKIERQTSKKIFAFSFAWCERALLRSESRKRTSLHLQVRKKGSIHWTHQKNTCNRNKNARKKNRKKLRVGRTWQRTSHRRRLRSNHCFVLENPSLSQPWNNSYVVITAVHQSFAKYLHYLHSKSGRLHKHKILLLCS